jgi:hypothetical protein
MYIKLLVDVFQMVFNSALRNVKRKGNLFVTFALYEQIYDFFFTLTELAIFHTRFFLKNTLAGRTFSVQCSLDAIFPNCCYPVSSVILTSSRSLHLTNSI